MCNQLKYILAVLLGLMFMFGGTACGEGGMDFDDSQSSGSVEEIDDDRIWKMDIDALEPFFTIVNGGTAFEWDENELYEGTATQKITVSGAWSLDLLVKNKTVKEKGYIIFWVKSNYAGPHEIRHMVKVNDGMRTTVSNYFTTEWTKVRIRVKSWNDYLEKETLLRINDDHNITGVTYWISLPTWQDAAF